MAGDAPRPAVQPLHHRLAAGELQVQPRRRDRRLGHFCQAHVEPRSARDGEASLLRSGGVRKHLEPEGPAPEAAERRRFEGHHDVLEPHDASLSPDVRR